MDQSTQIKCPNCGTTIDVLDKIKRQLQEEQSDLLASLQMFDQYLWSANNQES